jgi:hypothetical protein
VYEAVFEHHRFTGRSGSMYKYEGLGCIYWHMVSKLLLAVQENFFAARAGAADSKTCGQLAQLYYRVREGIGFNKTPAEYGAFPTDPYSHTPKHAGAQQPGMTGQVKEEILTRFGELGIRVDDGAVTFDPALLRAREFVAQPQALRYLDVDGQWQELEVPAQALGFTWCQVPFVYRRDDNATPSVTLTFDDGQRTTLAALALPAAESAAIFRHNGRIRRVDIVLTGSELYT